MLLGTASLTIELPPRQAQTRFNLRRREELQADTELARIEGRVETDRYGNILEEVWLCSPAGEMRFLARNVARPMKLSGLCPRFPKRVVLRT
jgi:hypothetical protein